MKILNLVQGTPEWIAARATYFTASEAPAMLGLSKYKSRDQLLREKATGTTEEVDSAKQRLFDAGHAAEDAARPIVEQMIGEDLFPATGSREVEGLPLLASFDGINMAEDTCWENKLFRAELASAIEAGEIDDLYWPQLEQQLLVSGAERVYFTASDGTEEKTIGLWYVSVPARRQRIIAGWKQFAEDLANYKPVEVIPAAVATPTLDLPTVSIQTSGQISIISNLKKFGEALQRFIERLPAKPSTDQEFADCKAALTKLKLAEDAIESEEAKALSQLDEIDEMRREKKLYQDLARTTRLQLEKLVTAREAAIKAEIVQEGKDKLAEHIALLNKRLGRVQMPAVPADFVGSIKNKRTVESLRNAVDTTLANAKISANEIADKIQINLGTLDEYKEFEFLFSDVATLAMKANDDLKNVIKLRISEHQAEQARKLEAERERIRKEEQERADREAAERLRQQEAEKQTAAPTVAEVAQEVIPSPSVASPVVAQSAVIHTTAKPTMTPAYMPDHAKTIISLIAGMNSDELKLVAHYCERIIAQRKAAA